METAAAAIAEVNNDAKVPLRELYDCETTRHISPYHENFEDYTTIVPKPLTAANKTLLSAVGQGDMVIEVPNGLNISKLQLTEVLYSPEVGYTLWLEVGFSHKKGRSRQRCTLQGSSHRPGIFASPRC